MKFKERPEGRVLEKGSKQNRYEQAQKIGDDGRREVKLPRPKKSPDLGKMCIYCGRIYPASSDDDSLICGSCSTPVVGF